ncbi:hypothetical protein BS78_04G199300 [Paspalum vaginatum]|nr:hypothetical protein BS78_04G199300 [Paspalum vaginatum]
MKVLDGLKIPDSKSNRNMYIVKLQRALYGLKQSGRMWYNRLSEFLLKKGYVNDPDSPCVFIRKSQKGFCIISVYVDDLNIIGCAEDIEEASFCLKTVLERFNMSKAHPLKTPMVVRSLEKDKDPFKPKSDDEEPLGPEHSANPTRRHWVGVKTVPRYLKGAQDLGLFFLKNEGQTMVGYADAGYLSDPHNARSQTGFRSCKQTLVATSTNHSEIIALYEAAHECAWLRRTTNHIQKSCGFPVADTPTIIYEDNAAYVAQMKTCYIKSNMTKHISPKFFYPHELQKQGEVKTMQVKSCDNLADLFTKSLPAATFRKCVRGIGMRHLKDLQGSGGECP